LQPLLEYAFQHIPEPKRKSAPAYLMATAGLRLVGEEKKNQILQSVCDKLDDSPFIFKCEWATLLSGYDEGLYGWVTTNYLMKTLSSPKDTTYGTIDLGGGSVQIVFEPARRAAIPQSYLAEVPLPGGEKHIYVKSHLGYGLDEARRSIASVVAKEGKSTHPCLPFGAASRARTRTDGCALMRAPAPSRLTCLLARRAPRKLAPALRARPPALPRASRAGYVGKVATTGGAEVTMKGTGDFSACTALVEAIFPKAECPLAPCSIQGAYQPSLRGDFVGFSYMYDRTKQIGLLDDDPQVYGEQRMSAAQIKLGAQSLCGLRADAISKKFARHPEKDKAQNFCGDVVFIGALIEHGFGFAPETQFTMTNKINKIEIVWTLGAMIAKVNEHLAGGGSSMFMISMFAICLLGLVYCFRKSLFGSHGLLPFRYNTL
jgi:Golgi nucleoside diphosphatase